MLHSPHTPLLTPPAKKSLTCSSSSCRSSLTMARASATRLRMPPLSSDGSRRSTPLRPTDPSASATRTCAQRMQYQQGGLRLCSALPHQRQRLSIPNLQALHPAQAHRTQRLSNPDLHAAHAASARELCHRAKITSFVALPCPTDVSASATRACRQGMPLRPPPALCCGGVLLMRQC